MQVRFFLLLVAALVGKTFFSYANNPRLDTPPRLVLQLVVGSLGTEVVDLHWESLTPGGLPRLYSRGVVCQDARYNHLVCNTSNGLATLVSGADVSRHGIVNNIWYSHVTGRKETFVADDFEHTVGAAQVGAGASPRRLSVSTLPDSWRLAYPSARLYSLAYDANDAILLAGRSSDLALWFDVRSGRWVSSSYYTDSLPGWVQQFNQKQLIQQYHRTEWLVSGSHTHTIRKIRRRPTDSQADTALKGELKLPVQGFTRLAHTPNGNSLLRDLIVAAVEGAGLGRGKVPDLLSVYFTPLDRIAEIYGTESAQFRDALLRFDKEIANLLDYLDYTVGRKEYLVVFTSAYASSPSPWLLAQSQVPSGYFNPDKAVYLLESYLSALYGIKGVVVGYSAQSVYLNEALLEKSHLPLQQVEQVAAKFLQDMNGVAAVYPMHVLQWSAASNLRITRAIGGFHPKRSGHLLIDLMPGWVVSSSLSTKARNAHYSYLSQVPLVFYGWRLRSRKISTPVYIRDVAATLARILYLREPNASDGNPIPGVGDWDDTP